MWSEYNFHLTKPWATNSNLQFRFFKYRIVQNIRQCFFDNCLPSSYTLHQGQYIIELFGYTWFFIQLYLPPWPIYYSTLLLYPFMHRGEISRSIFSVMRVTVCAWAPTDCLSGRPQSLAYHQLVWWLRLGMATRWCLL